MEKKVISGIFSEGEYVTVSINGKVIKRKVKFDNNAKDLYIIYNYCKYFYCEFEY